MVWIGIWKSLRSHRSCFLHILKTDQGSLYFIDNSAAVMVVPQTYQKSGSPDTFCDGCPYFNNDRFIMR